MPISGARKQEDLVAALKNLSPRVWIVAAVAAVIAVSYASRAPMDFAVGAWEVDAQDVGNYVGQYWGGPDFARMGAGMILGRLGNSSIEVDLHSDASYVVTLKASPPDLVDKALKAHLIAKESGSWEITKTGVSGGAIRFSPRDYELVEPKDANLQSAFKRAVAGKGPPREFAVGVVDSRTVEWAPVSGSGPKVTIRKR